jgi:hypothetical protein
MPRAARRGDVELAFLRDRECSRHARGDSPQRTLDRTSPKFRAAAQIGDRQRIGDCVEYRVLPRWAGTLALRISRFRRGRARQLDWRSHSHGIVSLARNANASVLSRTYRYVAPALRKLHNGRAPVKCRNRRRATEQESNAALDTERVSYAKNGRSFRGTGTGGHRRSAKLKRKVPPGTPSLFRR